MVLWAETAAAAASSVAVLCCWCPRGGAAAATSVFFCCFLAATFLVSASLAACCSLCACLQQHGSGGGKAVESQDRLALHLTVSRHPLPTQIRLPAQPPTHHLALSACASCCRAWMSRLSCSAAEQGST